MEITSSQINYFKKGEFRSLSNENVKHIKVLPYLSIVQSVEGSYDISLGNGETLQREDGGFFIAPSNLQQTIVHHVNKKSKKMTARWIFLDVEINKAFSLDSLYQFPVVIKDDRKNELNMLFDCLFTTDNVWENYSDCYKVLECLINMATQIQNEIHPGIQRAVAYLIGHYPERITIEMLANMANMSESNFYATFKKNMGCSPISYLNHNRLSIAADRLLETDKTLIDISYSVGINDALYFSKLFKKTYDMSPKEYRSVYKSQK